MLLKTSLISWGIPPPQLDSYWEESYDAISRIPEWQADELDMPTNPNTERRRPLRSHSLLDTSNSMHCLNEIRKSLPSEYHASYHIKVNTSAQTAQQHRGLILQCIRF